LAEDKSYSNFVRLQNPLRPSDACYYAINIILV
jgi:hypothetical protein